MAESAPQRVFICFGSACKACDTSLKIYSADSEADFAATGEKPDRKALADQMAKERLPTSPDDLRQTQKSPDMLFDSQVGPSALGQETSQQSGKSELVSPLDNCKLSEHGPRSRAMHSLLLLYCRHSHSSHFHSQGFKHCILLQWAGRAATSCQQLPKHSCGFPLVPSLVS